MKRSNSRSFTAWFGLGLATAALAGCSAADEKPRKGKYKPEVKLTALELPGITPATRAQAEEKMQAGFSSQVAGESCIGGASKDEWKKLSQELSKSLGGTCTTARDASTDSTVDTVLNCTGTQMGDLTATITGAAETESFRMEVNLGLDKLPNGAGKGRLGMQISATRIGDC